MAVNSVTIRRNRTAIASSWLSPALWSDFPFAEVAAGTCDAHVDGDHFRRGLMTEDAVDDTWSGIGYQKYIDTSNTIRPVAMTSTVNYGAVALITDATDNDGPVLHRCPGTNAASSVIVPFFIGNTAGEAFPLWFEARIKKSSVTDNQCAFFVGLIAGIHSAVAADNGVLADNTGDLVDSVSAIGWRALHDNGEELDFVYQDSGQTAPVEVMANVASLTADTYFNVGFFYNPDAASSRKITLYYNNQEQGTYVTTANIDASTFPENDMMNFVFATKNGEATATTGTIDFWQCAQVFSRL